MWVQKEDVSWLKIIAIERAIILESRQARLLFIPRLIAIFAHMAQCGIAQSGFDSCELYGINLCKFPHSQDLLSK